MKTGMKNKAVVVGSLGVIGRYIVDELLTSEGWSVIGMSRRDAPARAGYQHISVDLLNPAQCVATLASADLTDVTHIFFAGFTPGTGNAAGYASVIAPNRDLLINSVTAISAQARALQRVVLITGTKYYGSHLGPVKTPMREDDARHMPPNYYFDQVDWLKRFQQGKRWDWAELRPQTLCGFAPGTAMSIMPAIAVYAAISKELGLPLKFPGKPGAWTNLYQVTDSAHFASAACWAATADTAANQAFNVTNGDYFRWCHMWPRIAEVFDMPVGTPQMIRLTEHMGDKKELWASMASKYKLADIPFEQLVAWPFADYVFGTDWDVMSDLTKIRQAGFHAVVDSQEMFARILRQFREQGIVP